MRGAAILMLCGLWAGMLLPVAAAGTAQGDPPPTDPLRPVAAFADIADREARSRALFVEAGRVFQSPRCLNCHPAGDRPSQTDRLIPHEPPVLRGAENLGMPGMRCQNCHRANNFAASGVPGNPRWSLAPRIMAWQGKTLGQICAQIKDRRRNGGRGFAALIDHVSRDDLVGWAWHPGDIRTPAPGTQAQFGALVRAWIETGAACPV